MAVGEVCIFEALCYFVDQVFDGGIVFFCHFIGLSGGCSDTCGEVRL
jgi:hypothetical protein